jgi:hypothetical protein
MRKIFYLILVVGCFACGSKTGSNANDDTASPTNSKQNNNCIIDEDKIFNDTMWFLPYINVAERDTLRAVFEQWKFKLPVDEGFDEGCEITLTLYKDSTYIYRSPCEWVAEILTGTYFYCNDTLYCVEIGIGTIEDSDGLPKVQWLSKYVKSKNKLKSLSSKQQIVKGNMRVLEAPNELVFEKQD